MKCSKDTHRLYENENMISISMRIPVRMKDPIDPDILKNAVNKAIQRYPYFAQEVSINEDGTYLLHPNHREIVVLPVKEKTPYFTSEEVNYHFCFVEYEGNTILFNMSHAITGGKGVQPWVLTNIYLYVKEKYHINPKVKDVRLPGDAFLDGEIVEPTVEMLGDEEQIYQAPNQKPTMLIWEYLNGLLNPFVRKPNYYVYTFQQKDIIGFTKENDASVVSFFITAISKMLDHVLPRKYKVIGAETSHNPSEDIGLPYCHCDMHSMIYVDFTREQLQWDNKKLGTMTRGKILLQKDPSISKYQLKQALQVYEELNHMKGLKNKQKYIKTHSPSRGKNARHSTFVCNYSGFVDWGELSEYVEEYEIVVDGHLVFEITSLNDKIFLAMMQLLDTDKYVNELDRQFDSMHIPFERKGPFPKQLPKHHLPKE